jgi:hypothetical protein
MVVHITNDHTWWTELAKAIAHLPHSLATCESIASSSPMSLWECPSCHYTQLAIRTRPPTCTGGFENRNWQPIFGYRDDNLKDILSRIGRYSKETGSASAYEYHQRWLSAQS